MADYASEWQEWTIVPVGAGWAFAVGVIKQSGGQIKVRVAKGKMKAAASGELPITQAQKFNLKRSDWEGKGEGQPGLRELIDRYVAQLDTIHGEGDEE